MRCGPRKVIVWVLAFTADVTAVDAKTQTITLRGPQRTVELRVPDKKQFEGVKVGDQVEARYTEAVAVSMLPAKK